MDDVLKIEDISGSIPEDMEALLNEEVQSELGKKWFFSRLKFPAHLEKEFLRYYFAKRFDYIKLSLYVGSLIYAFFGLLDYFLYPAYVGVLWTIRFGIGVPFIVKTLVQFELCETDDCAEVAQAITMYVAGMTIIAMLSYLPYGEGESYYAGLMIVMFFNYAASGMRLKYSIATGVLLTLSYMVIAFTARQTGGYYMINNRFFLLSTNIVGTLASALKEKAVRRDFLLTYSLLLQKAEIERLNTKLQQLSRTDELTRLANRRYFHHLMEKDWKRLTGSHIPISLLMIDIDYFKNYNDALGHQAGDRCLTLIAEVIRQFQRNADDLAVRYGGEEFILVLPETPNGEAITIALRLRQAIMELKMRHPNSSVSSFVTVSIGVATGVPSERNSPADLIKAADEALYRAKSTGRNCVVNAVPPSSLTPTG